MLTTAASVYMPRWDAGEGCVEAGPAAALIYQAFREFYDLFSTDRPALLRAIAAQLAEEYSEIDRTRVLGDVDGVIGAYAAYPLEEMPDRQALSMRVLLGIEGLREDVFERIQEFRQGVSAVQGESLYLARIAVFESRRGAGHGQALLRDFEAAALGMGKECVSLHVRSDNTRAIRFYQAAGFAMDAATDNVYRFMSKKAA